MISFEKARKSLVNLKATTEQIKSQAKTNNVERSLGGPQRIKLVKTFSSQQSHDLQKFAANMADVSGKDECGTRFLLVRIAITSDLW